MKTDPEQLPSQIFDWVNACSFESLTAAQQQAVLQHLTAQQYNELHQAAAAVSGTLQLPQTPGHAARKAQLIKRFQEAHQPKGDPAFRAASLWRLAAVLLLTLSGWMFHWMSGAKPEVQVRTVTQRDTVWVKQEVPVAVNEEAKMPQPPVRRELAVATPRKIVAPAQAQTGNGLNVISIQQLGAVQHQPRGNSLADDSLARRFAFATL